MRTIAGQCDPRGIPSIGILGCGHGDGQATRGRDARPTHGRDAHATGMTLVELMVSLAILSIMILMASTLLVRARRTMQVAEASVEINGDLRAISDYFRRDVARISKDGFLFIQISDVRSGYVNLVFTEAARSHSMTTPVDANAALVCYTFTKTSGSTYAINRASRLLLDQSLPAAQGYLKLIQDPNMNDGTRAIAQNQLDYFPLSLSMFRHYPAISRLQGNPILPRQMIMDWLMPPANLWLCGICGATYDPSLGSGISSYNTIAIPPGIPWVDDSTPPQLSVLTTPAYANWVCPNCGAPKAKFSHYEGFFSVQLPGGVTALISGLLNMPPMSSGKADSLNDVRYNWTLMSAQVTGQRPVLQWTDGSRAADGSLHWFDGQQMVASVLGVSPGLDNAYYQSQNHPDSWRIRNMANPLQGATASNRGYPERQQDLRPEENLPEFGDRDTYMAMWTFSKTDNWPKAIRLYMTAGDNPPKSLEIIVPLPD